MSNRDSRNVPVPEPASGIGETTAFEREDYFRKLIENSSDLISIYDADWTLRYQTPSIKRVLGWDTQELLGRRVYDFIHPDDLVRARRGLEKVREAPGVHPSGEVRLCHKDGSWRWFECVATNLLDDPVVEGIVYNARDVTERVEAIAALSEREEELRHAQRLEAIGRLAGGIAHDFNNLITIISGYSELTLRKLASEDPLRPDIERIRQATNRAADLTHQLLAFSRRQVLEPKVLDLNAMVAGLGSMLERLLGEDVELVVTRDAALGRVMADPGQIEQVIVNLALNARDAMPRGGRLTIETSNVHLGEVYSRSRADTRPGSYVLIAVTDTGIGMDAEVAQHIFEPFFTTKGVGKGTGLGLATVYGIVKQTGGSIEVYSSPGDGTSFKIYLPRVEDAVADADVAASASESPIGHEVVLVAEDEIGVRQLIVESLCAAGYFVLEAANGGEAFMLSKMHEGPIHLLVADAIMPRIGGQELAERLSVTRPEMKVLFISGYSETSVVHGETLEGGVDFLAKPFRPSELAIKVRELLDAPTPD